jgi:hypothetical protein
MSRYQEIVALEVSVNNHRIRFVKVVHSFCCIDHHLLQQTEIQLNGLIMKNLEKTSIGHVLHYNTDIRWISTSSEKLKNIGMTESSARSWIDI